MNLDAIWSLLVRSQPYSKSYLTKTRPRTINIFFALSLSPSLFGSVSLASLSLCVSDNSVRDFTSYILPDIKNQTHFSLPWRAHCADALWFLPLTETHTWDQTCNIAAYLPFYLHKTSVWFFSKLRQQTQCHYLSPRRGSKFLLNIPPERAWS